MNPADKILAQMLAEMKEDVYMTPDMMTVLYLREMRDLLEKAIKDINKLI